MSERLTTAEAAEALGVHPNTVKHWIGQVDVPAEKDGAGRWRFDERALEVLRAVKDLRDSDRTFETIRRRIDKRETSEQQDGAQDTPGARQVADEYATTPQHPGDNRALSEALAAAVGPQLVEAIAGQTELAEKYARATYTIGQLEERTTTLQAQLADTRERMQLLQSADDERGQLSRDLADAKVKIAELEAHVARQAHRPWWRPW